MIVKYVSAEEFYKYVHQMQEKRIYPTVTYNGYLPTRIEIWDQNGSYYIEIAPTELMKALV